VISVSNTWAAPKPPSSSWARSSFRSGRPLDSAFVAAIASQIAAAAIARHSRGGGQLRRDRWRGCANLNLPDRPTDLARLQAVAAVGQRRLMDVGPSVRST